MKYDRYIAKQGKKRKAIKYKGTYCQDCNMNLIEKPWLAEFHHINPDEKEFKPADMLIGIYWKDEVYRELDKCVLLCRNCHATCHADVERFEKNQDQIDYYCDNQVGKRNSTKKEREMAIKLRGEGMTYSQISKIMPFGEETIRKWMPSKPKLTKKEIDSIIIKEYTKGTSFKEIACILKMRYENFRDYADRLLLEGKILPKNKWARNRLERLKQS